MVEPVKNDDGQIDLVEKYAFDFDGFMHKDICSNRCAEALIAKVIILVLVIL